MNDEAREVLVTAALRGHQQARRVMHGSIGDCALGVLHLTMHATRDDAIICRDYSKVACERDMLQRFGLGWGDTREIIHRNDDLSQDFLTIANKTGHENPPGR